MKKLLLKATFVCLGITLLCGMYSFKTPQKELLKNIKEVVIEKDLCDCNYHLYVENGVGWWYLKLKNGCPDPIIATCKYTIYYEDGSSKSCTQTVRLNGNWETIVDRGNSDHSSCTADDVSARFAQ